MAVIRTINRNSIKRNLEYPNIIYKSESQTNSSRLAITVINTII